MAMPPPPPPPAGRGNPDRKTVERNRRNQMNGLYSRLDALVRAAPPPPTGGTPATTRPDRLDAAAAYIRRTEERVESLRGRKRELITQQQLAAAGAGSSAAAGSDLEVEVQHMGSGLHAILVTGAAPPSDGASFHRAVRAVEEAGGEVQNAHFSVVGARAIYTIHTLLVGEEHGGGIERVVQRLKGALRGGAYSGRQP